MKYLQFIATFMSMLVITIPMYSASVYAGIDRISAKGSDGIDGFVKGQDYVNFEAFVSVAGNGTVTKDQVWLGQNFKFDSCSADVNGYKCSLRYPASGTSEWESRAVPYTINLKKDGSAVEGKSGTIYVDDLAPEISSFSAEPAVVSTGDIKFKYTVNDKACSDSSCSGKCSGTSKLELYELNGSYSETVVVNGSGCSYSSEISKASSTFAEGRHTVYAKAYDNMGKVSEVASATFKVDNSAPQINAASFKITDETGLDMEYASPQTISVKVYIEINEDALDKDSVVGDFTSIDSGYNNLKASCSATIDSVSKCTWPINLAVSEDTSKKFVIKAKDLAGNEAKVEVTKQLGVDTAGPVVKSIKTDRVKEGKSYAKLQNNTLIAEITENVGLNPKQVILHTSGSSIKANNCSTGWSCSWQGVGFTAAGTAKVSIKDDTTDRLGNTASPFTADITIDTNLPRLVNISIGAAGGEEEAWHGYLKTGDSFQIKAVLEDEAIETAYADLSYFITNAKEVQADSCESIGSNKWQCSWVTTSIDISGFIENYAFFKFEDVAGNVLEYKEAVTVYGLVNDTNVNYWTQEVSCSPKLVDRQTTSLINQKVFCHVKLQPLQENIMPLSISLGECSNDTTAIQEAEVFNNDIGGRDPYIKFILKKSDFDVNEVNLNCPLYITTKIGNVITASPEEEEVAVKLEFYNMPLGELSAGVKNKIKEAVDDANNGVLKLVTVLKKGAFYAEKICRIIGIINNLVAVLKGIGAAFSGMEEAAKAYPPSYGPMRGMRMAHDMYTEVMRDGGLEIFKYFDKFCKFVNCQQVFSEDDKWTGWMESWRGGGNKLLGFMGHNQIAKWTIKKNPNEYMNPRDSMAVALLTGCIPGIIYNLDKWRQIQCMYAHCLQEGVKQQGLPIIACEDQKSYAECKYITGEIFKVFPVTALFDYYMSLVKNLLSDPLGVIELALGFFCKPKIPGGTWDYHICTIGKIMAIIGEIAGDITSIIKDGFKIRDDYCDKLKDEV